MDYSHLPQPKLMKLKQWESLSEKTNDVESLPNLLANLIGVTQIEFYGYG